MTKKLVLLILAVAGPCSAQTDDDLRKVVELICPKGEYDKASGTCNACPDGATSDTVKLKPIIESTISGHLLRPDSDDLMVTFKGCEASFDRRDFTFNMLFTKSATGWTVAPGEGWFGDGTCTKIPNRQGRDGLLCSGDIPHSQGMLTESVVYFNYVDRKGGGLLLAAFSAEPSCSMNWDGDKPRYPQAHITDVKLSQENGARPSLRITATCRRVRRVCSEAEPDKVREIPVTPVREYSVDYQFDGAMFRLAPGSQAAKRAYDACAHSKWDEDYK